MKLNEVELNEIQGGAINATFINAIARLINSILDLGRTVGSSIRSIYTKNYC